MVNLNVYVVSFSHDICDAKLPTSEEENMDDETIEGNTRKRINYGGDFLYKENFTRIHYLKRNLN